MIFDAGTGAAREIVMVLALAVAGLLLAVVAAFTPWYDGGPAFRQGPVVEMVVPHDPATATNDRATATKDPATATNDRAQPGGTRPVASG